MQVLRSISEAKSLIPSDKIIGATSFQKKNSGGLHDGHVYLINTIKSLVEKTVITFYDDFYLMYNIYPDEGPSNSPVTWDEAYCLNWADTNGVDFVFVPPPGFLFDITGVSSIEVLKTQTDTIISNEGYSDAIPSVYNTALKYSILSTLLSNEIGGFFKKDYHFCSWEQNIIPFIRKDFYTKYTTMQMQILEPLRRPDGLCYSTRLLTLPQNKIDVFLNIRNEIVSQYDSTSTVNFSDIDINSMLNGLFTLTTAADICNTFTESKHYVTWNLVDVETNLIYNFGELF